MSFRDFVKKHFPINHPTPQKPKKKPSKKRRTVSGYSTGDRVLHLSWNGTCTPCTIRRVWGHALYLQPETSPNETWYAGSSEVQPA